MKLDCGILDSSLWTLDAVTCKVFITMLAMAELDGLCRGTAPGIASRSKLPVDQVRAALSVLESPDPDSRTPDDEGRRIRRVDGGYLVLNYLKYREYDHGAAGRMKALRERRKQESVTANARNVRRTSPNASASASPSASDVQEGGLGGGEIPAGQGWSPNREAVMLAQRWAQVNPKTLDPAKASQHFAEGLLSGIDPKVLLAAVNENKGRKPWEIVQALKPKMDKPAKKNDPEAAYRKMQELLNDPEEFRKATS